MLGATWSGKFQADLEDKFLPTYRDNRPQTDAEMLAELAKIPKKRD